MSKADQIWSRSQLLKNHSTAIDLYNHAKDLEAKLEAAEKAIEWKDHQIADFMESRADTRPF